MRKGGGLWIMNEGLWFFFLLYYILSFLVVFLFCMFIVPFSFYLIIFFSFVMKVGGEWEWMA